MAIRRLVFLILLSVLRLGRANAFGYGRSFQPLTPVEPPFTPVEPPNVHHKEPLGPAFAPAPSPEFSDKAQTVGAVGHRHQNTPPAHSPSFKFEHDCTGFFCSEPLTLAPLGTPCACVLPMKVEIELGVAAFWVFTLVAELAVEIATGTYVKQSQVRVVAAVSSGIGQEKTRVLIHLLPLGERFDRMSAFLISDRFWRKEIPINSSLFGDYKVLFVAYPGIPASVPYHKGPGDHDIPFAARLPTKRSKKMNPRIIAAVASSSLIFAVLCATVACIILKAKKNGNSSAKLDPLFLPPVKKQSGTKFMISSSMASTTSLSLASTVATCPSSIKTFTMAELELATSQFSPKKVLGEGGFGCVYHGIIDDGSEVAVKLLKRQDENGDREFISEIEMLSRLHHRNLVKLLGICIEGCARCLVYELVRNGSVESHLYDADKKRGHLDWDTRVKIALGSARALAYLHEDSNPRVIHRDFKASNILLEDDFTPRVSDFGLARVAGEGSHHVSTHVMGTFGYVAPEYAMTGHLLVKSDVYSYGVVLLELLSGRKPVDMSRPPGQENLVTWARSLLASKEGLAQLVDPSLEGKYDFDSLAKVAAIAAMCVQPEVSHRPFMGEVVQALKLLSNDRYDGCEDIHSHRDSCIADCDEFKIETNTEGSWWERPAPLDAVRGASSYMTMEYNSSPPDEMSHAPLSPSLVTRMNSSVRLNRSGPLRTERNMDAFAKLRGCESEHGLPSRYPAVGY